MKLWRWLRMMINRMRFARELTGVVVKDLHRYLPAFYRPGNAWVGLCNRYETLEWSDDGVGARCCWQWTSVLHAPTVLPFFGRQLLRRALCEHPVCFADAPEGRPNDFPEISFIIGHRGLERLPHLLTTLKTIAGQCDVRLECIVVEQSEVSEIQTSLPAWVRYVHTPPSSGDMPYCRAWAFNVGAGLARSDQLVLHDNDLLIPADYAKEHLRLAQQGFKVVNLKRFIFYLSQAQSGGDFGKEGRLTEMTPETVMQNAQGGSIAVGRHAYEQIGGFDESFIGWGGEDNEFWERAQTLKTWSYGYLPLLHLWHPPQPGKYQADATTLKRYQELSAMPVRERIACLRSAPGGILRGTSGFEPR